MNPSNRTLSMMSPKVRQSIMAVSVVMALGLSNVAWADNMSERFASHARYTEYQKALDTNDKEKAYAIKKQMAEEICDSIMVQVVDESNALAKKGIKARYDKWDIQTKVNFVNIYLKSKKILVNEDKRATFNPNIIFFIESIYQQTGNTLYKAKDIQSRFEFNDNNVFINDLIEIAKITDSIAASEKSIAANEKSIAEWDKIIKRLEKLGQ